MTALLERSDTLDALGDLLGEVRSRREGRLVLVGGEAGVGKTSVLRAFCDAQGRDVRVLWGASEPLHTQRPLSPFVDVAAALGGGAEELVSREGVRPHEVADALLRALTGSRPAVLVLEDLHWADDATLDVLVMLATRVTAVPALVLGSFRDEGPEQGGRLRLALGGLVPGRHRLRLAPLSPAAVAELAAPHALDPAELHDRTGGNPFFVTEVLAAGGEDLPETVRDAVLSRAARLSEPALALLEAAAVVPGEVDLDLLRDLAGDDADALDECLAAGVLRAEGARVAFRHELARRAVEAAVSPGRRLALHRAALAALTARAEGGEEDLSRLAHHAEAADDAPAVLRWAPRAAERAAASGAHREAADQLARALRFAGEGDPRLRAQLAGRRAQECYLTSQLEEAVAAQEEALACLRALGDVRAEGDALRRLSRLLFFAGRTAEGEPAALQAIEILERLEPGHELAMAYANVSQRRMVEEDTEAAIAWGTRALELAAGLGDAEAEVYALANLGAARGQAGELDAGQAELERAHALAAQHGLEDHAGRALSLLVLGPLRPRRLARAAQHVDRAIEYCTARGLDTWRLYVVAYRSRLELLAGRWDDAGACAALALRHPRSASVARTWALTTLGLLRARRGDAGAAAALDEAEALGAGTGELFRVGPTAAARAELAWLTGDPGAIPGLTEEVLELAVRRRDPWVAGELSALRRLAGVDDGLAPALVAEPYRLVLSGDAAGAAAAWAALGCVYDEALARAQDEDPDAARAGLEALQALGARAAATVVARALRDRGVRNLPRGPRPRTRENPAGLTARELEVVALLAEGLRNAQIAERLVVADKTVDHHVSAVLRKLGASSRGEAAAAALRLGLVPTPEKDGRLDP